jgi:hypothetical protein
MTITATQKNSTDVDHSAVGSHFDDAASPALFTAVLGFVPKYIRFTNVTDRIQWEWFDGSASGTTLKTVAAGTRTLDTADVAIVTSTAGRFTVPAALILQNKQYRWEARG